MVQYSLEHRLFIYNTYIKKRSIKKCRDKFGRKFPGITVPHKFTIQQLVKKMQETGSLLNRERRVVKKVLTEEKIDEIGFRLEQCPRKTLRQLSQQCNVSKATAWRATKALRLKLYRSTDVNRIAEPDNNARVDICNILYEDISKMEKMAKPLRIEEVNSLGNEECANIFKNIVESFPRVAQAVCIQRPFNSADHIADAAGKYLDELPLQGKEEVLKLHPDLAGRLADEGKLTNESAREQQSAGLDKLSTEDKLKMNQLNARYQEKFGFPFVICARENKVAAILQGLETRLSNSRDKELGTGINEVKKICRLRVKEIVMS